jgi:DNA gyrase/topoisomerase IV subunit B
MSESPVDQGRYSAANIEVLTGLEAIRRRPAMYVGSLDAPELPSRLLLEALCHAIDEVIDGGCTTITISLSGEASAWVEYNAGMSLEPSAPGGKVPAAEVFLVHAKGCHNLKKHLAVGDRHCKLGLAVLNAFSEELIVTTRCAGKSAILHFSKGAMAPYGVAPTDEGDYTRIAFKINHSLISGDFDEKWIRAEVEAVSVDYPQAQFLFAV